MVLTVIKAMYKLPTNGPAKILAKFLLILTNKEVVSIGFLEEK